MTKTFKCPSCGGPIDYAGGDAPTVRCPFCSNSVIVPPELRSGQAVAAGAAAAPPPAAPAVAPADTSTAAPANPEEIRAKLKEARHAAREQRRSLRHQLHEARHRSRHQ